MSLESQLEKTNELLAQIITILNTGIQAPAELGTPAKTTQTKATKAVKTEAAAPVTPVALAATTEGARYFVLEKHNTVFVVQPGEAVPSVEGAVEVSKEVYEAKKSELAARFPQAATTTDAKPEAPSAPSQPTAEAVVAAAPAPSTAQPAPQSATAQPADANSASDVPFADVVAAMQKLAVKDRSTVLALLAEYLPGVENPRVPQLAPLGKNAEIKAKVTALLG